METQYRVPANLNLNETTIMKNVLKTSAAVIALTALFVGPASAMVSKGDLNRDILSAVGADSNVTVNVNSGVVTLSGYFGDAGAQNAAIRAAQNSVGVTEVINLATQSN